MLKQDRTSLDYFALVKQSRRLVPGAGQPFRLALLADVSTQHLVPLLQALLADNGLEAEIYEAGYDTVELEAHDAGSRLYEFQPQLVCILQSLQKLKPLYYEFDGNRASFSQAWADRIEGVWTAIEGRAPASIAQSTFVLPYERPFGNFGLKVEDTLHGAVAELNRELSRRARRHPSVFLNDVDHLAAWVGRRQFLDERLWALSKSLCALEFLPDVAQNIVDLALAVSGRGVKCVVLDLDNTLWGGVVGEDGMDALGLGDLDEGGAFRSFQLYLRELSRRGIVLAVCSKNDEALARQVFRQHPAMRLREEDIAVFVANWDDKATNIRRIRDTLNIGFDAMVFLDDNPFERNLVRRLLPDVIVPELPEDPARYVRALSELNLFETASSSALDERRGAMYREQAVRDEVRGRFADVTDYLRSLETVAECSRFGPHNLPRVAQLIQRSNQFNVTTRRYSQVECAAMADDLGIIPFCTSIADRFGDFGLINVVILRKAPPVLEIDTFLMSCRVLQRGVEQFAMNRIFEYARLGGFERVVGRYIPTAKNGMVKDLFRKFGFVQTSSSAAEGDEWTTRVDEYVPQEVFIRERSSHPDYAGATQP
jgi:FkbH-like protein